jgi:rare lipoprotein A (peptidoglycan hydrolase)
MINLIKKLLPILSIIFLIASCEESSLNNYQENDSKKRGSKFSHLETKENIRLSGSRRPKPTETSRAQSEKYVFPSFSKDGDSRYNTQDDIDYGSTEAFIDDGKYTGRYKVGKPYKIRNITYEPKKYDNFEEVGTASWYGDAFHGKQTANGEIYHMGDMTAAHPTLPLPSMVKVTNLGNNKTVIVRVNDRGPFAKNRIIDLSQRAARELDYKNKGTANVKVELLPKETEELLTKLNLK